MWHGMAGVDERSFAGDGRAEQLKFRPGHRNIKTFLECTAAMPCRAMRKAPVMRSKQQRRNVPWTGRAGGTLLKTLLRWNLRSPNRLDVCIGLALAVAGVANVVQLFLVCDPVAGSAVGPGPGLVSGALCNDCDLAAEDMEALRPEKPVLRVKSKECVCVGGGVTAAGTSRWTCVLRVWRPAKLLFVCT
eukprot:356488-Chlamydomonas_euryale.AAC.2